MKWEKLGRIFVPDGTMPWMHSHASNPCPLWLKDDIFRIYFSSRNDKKQSSVGSLDIDIKQPGKILSLTASPVLTPGAAGQFDDSGLSVAQIVRHDNRTYLYYLGWHLRSDVPFCNTIGLAIEEGSGPFIKHALNPVVGIAPQDPLSLSYPCVIVENQRWRMWYGSHLTWEANGLDMQHVIKYAESADGIRWERNGSACIPLDAGESALSRPCVVKDKDGYHMWYSIRTGRNETYRLGYAVSPDGIGWARHDDKVGITVSKTGWDSEMICYPQVFDHRGTRYMLYNGNRFGMTGFGLAVAS